ncbi:unnamed protein product [Euphydryas editha]|uniref:C2H2-type domain-containing protein n=1 Tax=Euphydryas editha TaxID=104508 RepID=A0AAU9V691_EUPED|nr:unnamed protein product [Euphydryas editha]
MFLDVTDEKVIVCVKIISVFEPRYVTECHCFNNGLPLYSGSAACPRADGGSAASSEPCGATLAARRCDPSQRVSLFFQYLIASDSDEGTYLNLFARLAVKLQPEAPDFKQIPYDWFCPSVHDKLASRTCKECGLYHTSNKTLLQHLKILHLKQKRKVEVVRRVQPTRIAARRARELLCIIGDENDGTEDAEWLDDDEVDGSFQDEEEDGAIPIVDISAHLENP